MPSVVLLHCSGSSGAQWRAAAAQLGSRYRVAAPDFVGYGSSAPWSGRGAFSIAHEAAAVRSVIGQMSGKLSGRAGEPVHLVGHSYGGAVALHLARTRPELVASLTLVEPVAFNLLRSGDAIDVAALREIVSVAGELQAALAAGDYAGGFGRFMDYWAGAGSWAAMGAEKRAAFAPQLAKVVLEFHALFSDPAELDDLRGIAVPTLIVQGGCTTLPPRCICRRLRDALPHAAFQVVRGAGHMLPLTHRDEVNGLIAAHLDSLTNYPGENHAVLAA